MAFALILGLGAVMVAQINQLAADLPRYQSTLREKIQSFRGLAAGSGTLERAAEVLQDLGKELEKPKAAERAELRPGGSVRTDRSRSRCASPIPAPCRPSLP